ncbi:MAG: hypothetical protein ACHQF3_13365 [Alphaproteobacteria bacterium]
MRTVAASTDMGCSGMTAEAGASGGGRIRGRKIAPGGSGPQPPWRAAATLPPERQSRHQVNADDVMGYTCLLPECRISRRCSRQATGRLAACSTYLSKMIGGRMLADLIYDDPTWLVGSVIVAASILVSCAGLFAFHRLVGLELRRSHNDVAGFMIAIVGILYAVLLAFIAVTTWETYSKAGDAVDNEANAIGNTFFDTAGVPDAIAARYRRFLSNYVQLVINEEWPAQHAGHTGRPIYQKGWAIIGDLNVDVAHFEPKTQGESNMHSALLRDLDLLFSARQTRQLAADSHIPEVVWWIIFFGGVLTVAFTYLFGAHSFKMHLTMTGGVAASLALVIVLIVSFDFPFRGEVTITSEAYQAVRGMMASYTFQPK